MREDDPLISAESKLTDRYQTTIPEMVRKALRLGKGDKLEYLLDESGGITIRKSQKAEPKPEHLDPALLAFLELLEKDISAHPERLIPGQQILARMTELISRFPKSAYDPEEPLERIADDPDDNDDWLHVEIKK